MIIHPVTTKTEDGELCVSAHIELETSPHNLPQTLWFKFPETYGDFLTDRADGFPVALLPVAMARSERLQVRAALSPRLAYGIQEYTHLFGTWFGAPFKPVEVHADRYERAGGNKPEAAVATAFSGGVDSFYTLWSHLAQNEKYPGNAVSYGLFVHGFDIPLEDHRSYPICCAAYSEMLGRLGVQLLSARSNVLHFYKGLDLALLSGPVVIGMALFLERLLGRCYIPAGSWYADSFPLSAYSLTDHLLSTESMEFITDGAQLNKFAKIAIVAGWQETYDRLRVCYKKSDGLLNCCRCGKCILTMTALEALGVLSNYSTFPQPLTSWRIRTARITEGIPFIVNSVREGARTHGRGDLDRDLGIAMAWNPLRWRAKRFIQKLRQGAIS